MRVLYGAAGESAARCRVPVGGHPVGSRAPTTVATSIGHPPLPSTRLLRILHCVRREKRKTLFVVFRTKNHNGKAFTVVISVELQVGYQHGISAIIIHHVKTIFSEKPDDRFSARTVGQVLQNFTLTAREVRCSKSAHT